MHSADSFDEAKEPLKITVMSFKEVFYSRDIVLYIYVVRKSGL
ncbi:hypothetical protein TPHV1_30200 [Treponema phagedenis]|uniref:Uncharacterized protein n=1 Tax=Treponema phagedenis TaxID=162 RepID=A0A0B7GZA4_TREPH|nr:hypothetical protein TPHV1_30200 [Treponema phagedenis]